MTATTPTMTAAPGAKRAERTRARAPRKPAKPASPAARRKLFLATLIDTNNVAQSARVAGIATSTLYRQRSSQPAFAREWEAARQAAADELESVLMKRAVEGVARPIVYAGETVATVTTYSDALGMFMLRRLRPADYGERAAPADDAAPVPRVARDDVERRLARLRETTAPDADQVVP